MNERFPCDSCKKDFSTKSNLTQHMRRNKGCLWLREKEANLVCNFCNNNITKTEYENHIKNCVFKVKVSVLLEENKRLQEEKSCLEKHIISLENTIKTYKRKSPQLFPLSREHILETLKLHMEKSASCLDQGPYYLGVFYANIVLKDRAFCTDMTRHTIHFVHEVSQTIVVDSGCKLIVQQFLEIGSDIVLECINKRLKEKRDDLLAIGDSVSSIISKEVQNIEKCKFGISGELRIDFTKKFVSGICNTLASYKNLL